MSMREQEKVTATQSLLWPLSIMGPDSKVSATSFEVNPAENSIYTSPNDQSKRTYGPTELRYVLNDQEFLFLRNFVRLIWFL